MTCPNCQQPVEDGRLICPHCGAFITPTGPPPPGASVWPPPPASGSVVPGAWPPAERLLTGRRRLDFAVGFLPPPILTTLFVAGYEQGNRWLTVGAGALFLASLVLCLALTRRLPVVARGLVWGLIAIPALVVLFLLGAFAVCLYSVARPGR